MSPDAGQMLPKRDLAQIFGDSIAIVGVGVERDLGIDDQVTAAGEIDDDVGARSLAALAVFIYESSKGLLEAILLALAQAGLFEQIAQDELAPVALRLGGAAQRGGEVMRLGA